MTEQRYEGNMQQLTCSIGFYNSNNNKQKKSAIVKITKQLMYLRHKHAYCHKQTYTSR